MANKYSTEAIVLSLKNWGEADRIVTLFTRERGKVEAIVYGARRLKNRFNISNRPFTLLNVQLSSGRKLDILQDCEYKGVLVDLSAVYQAYTYAAFLVEIIEGLFAVGEKEEAVFDKLLQIFPFLTKRNPRIITLIAFVQLLQYTGEQFVYKHCLKCQKIFD